MGQIIRIFLLALNSLIPLFLSPPPLFSSPADQDSEKGNKSKESKGLGDSKNKSSKRLESVGEKEVKNAGLVEKEGSSWSGRGESRRKSEKESGRIGGKEARELKEKDRGFEREKKGQESKRDSEVCSIDSTVLAQKQGSQWKDGGEDR